MSDPKKVPEKEATEEKREEVKEAKKEQPKEDVKKEEKVAAKEEKPKAPEVAKSARVKVTSMTLQEVEKGLENAQQNMGGYHSDFARALLARKAVLEQEMEEPKRKAA